ncbi:helix-hairpin-helix domain-containing protein [Clostridium estertheticum]|uniref:Helix-hairpin-helix DNA-binding motif class 1 domain-containing protein n=1 Tax=Clostridium estertheticum subsp. estertheticum TaxID=1552 RepID=A0A1J0GJ30_9CLOT|nr:helix-hairpin-helix domain-containing protein [Clostridium estertheticum]APC41323.1 hypothetical protein A7L45_15175 [Clostridium estertheticum subsp. estertheticum]MBU3073001.1 helix-hairpin-helix domain-containing protein [Clostridium estertheticum]MBU3162962.1 helix-hairpin-helix domain-containing protein [Clostridium estertheticum]MBU3172811.1 helix-hairpin-helix domain-containing protein [Clostridium estertheticum]MBZ9616838.1 helix-hairpin-helix domain-containing protein [Clostridium 
MKSKEKIIGSIAILCISIIFIIIGFVLSGQKGTAKTSDYKDVFIETDKTSQKNNTDEGKSSLPSKVEESNVKSQDSIIKVDIKGAVKSPGVYEIKNGSRVTDLIKLAGGGTKDADLNATNLSKKLNDEDCIVINKNGEVNKTQMPNGSTSNASTPNSITANPTKSSTVSSSDNKGKGGIININTASKEELMTLTGIGETKANIIIDYRKQSGGFKSVDELTKVGGIGEKTLSKFIDKIDIK